MYDNFSKESILTKYYYPRNGKGDADTAADKIRQELVTVF